jgi:hypothetical protein
MMLSTLLAEGKTWEGWAAIFRRFRPFGTERQELTPLSASFDHAPRF